MVERIESSVATSPSSQTLVSSRRDSGNESGSSSSSGGKPLALRTDFKSFTAMATILVSPTKQRFLIHRELLIHYSRFFGAALKGRFAEAETQTVSLPEETVSCFEYFVNWLYTQSLDTDVHDSRGAPTYFVLLELWALGDRLEIEALKNDAVDKIAECSERTNSVPTPSDTWIVYERMQTESRVKKLVLDLFVWKKTDNLLERHEDEWHPRFLRELCVHLKRPATTSIERHFFVEGWRPGSWKDLAACDVCRGIVKPAGTAGGHDAGVWKCEKCERIVCRGCYARGTAGCGWDWPREGGCKPWLRNMCQYHEHLKTPPCSQGVARRHPVGAKDLCGGCLTRMLPPLVEQRR